MIDRKLSGNIRPSVDDMTCTRRHVLRAGPMAAAALAAPALILPARAQTTVVRIGHTQSLTGPSSPWGIRARDGAFVAESEINAAGGFADRTGRKYTVQIVSSDMANDPKQAITLFRQQASDPSIVASMGPTNSVGFLPCIPVAKQIGMLLVGNGSGAPVKEWNPWVYRVNLVADVATPSFLKMAVKAASVRRLAVIFDQTQDAQVADARFCQGLAREIGYEVVAYESYRSGDQDFSPQLTKIRAAKPDAVFVAASTGDGVRVVTQMRESGIKAPLFTGYGVLVDPVYWDGTKGGIDGGYTWVDQDLKRAGGVLKDWLDRYNAKFSLEATSYSIYGYDAVYAIVECVRRAASTDRAAIREVMSSLEFVGPLGTRVTFKNPPTGNNLTPSLTVLKVDGRGAGQAIV